MLNSFMAWAQTLSVERIIILIAIIPAAYFVERALFFILRRTYFLKKWVPTNFDLREHFANSTFWLFLILAMQIAAPIVIDNEALFDRVQNILVICLILVCTWLLSQVAGFARISIFLHLDVSRADNLKARRVRTQIQFIQKIVLGFIYLIAIALILTRFEAVRRLGTSLFASAGLSAIIIGFAAQKSLTNFLAGFQIAFTQPIRIDDVVIVEGEWGKIEEITFTYVVVRIWDKRTLVVPITYFIEKPFQNWTRTTADLLGVAMIYVDYRMPIDPLRAEFEKVLKASTQWDQKVLAVQVTDCTKDVIEVRFLAGARNAPEAFDLRCIVREKMIAFIQQNYPDGLPQHRLVGSPAAAASAAGLSKI